MAQFKREPKMKTTEPSVDEVGKGMKKGGKANGGAAMMGRPAPALMRQRPMVRTPVLPIMRKEGGETKKEHQAEMHKMSKIEKELKQHEHEKASKAHRGLKAGGNIERATPGGLLPGVTKAQTKGTTGGVREPGYKKGGGIGPYVNTKVVDDSSGRHRARKTSSGIEGTGYKKGGSVAEYANTKMHDAAKGDAVKKKGTGDIELSKFKDGGHVTMQPKGMAGFKAKGGMCKY
jgi:hypothetical protein